MAQPIMQLNKVTKTFVKGGGIGVPRQLVPVIRDVSFDLSKGEVLCLVGESGCGKTTTGKMMAGLIEPTSGDIIFEGETLQSLDKKKFSKYRRAVQLIHQDPYASLNPTQSIYSILSAPLFRHKLVHSRAEAAEKVADLLRTVDLTPVEDYIDKYPHQLSGGQRQRVVVARSLTLNPEVIVADEAVSMLDVSIRLSVIGLLKRMQKETDVAFVFITHDLAMAKYFGSGGKIAVMYLGQIVEYGDTRKVIDEPLHPYTQALLAAIPEPDPDITRQKKAMKLRSLDIPDLTNLPKGCTFHPRCPMFMEGRCEIETPTAEPRSDGRMVTCYLDEETARQVLHQELRL